MSVRSEFVRLWNEFIASGKKISQLNASAALTGTEQVEINQGGVSVRATTQGIANLSGGGAAAWGSITGTLSAQTDLQAALDLKESLYRVFDRKTANYPLVLADGLKGIEMNMAGVNTVTVPLNATQAFPVGTLIPVVQYGVGLTSIVFTGGVTSRSSSGNLDSPGQYSPMFLRKIATDEWYLWNGTAGGGAVSSVFSRTGAVAAAANDYSADQITNTPTGGISAIDVQGAIDELDTFRPTFDEMNAAIQTALEGLSWKDSVRVATTVAGTLATSFENGDTVDGVVLATGDSILIKDQADPTQNGIYVVAASGAPTRRADSDSSGGLQMATVSVDEGTSNANTTWIQTTDAVTIGASNIVFTQFGSSVPDASETVKGIVELATQAEVTTGTDDVRAVTPLKLAVATRGVQDLFISASAMWPRTTGPCADLAKTEIATSLFNIQSLDFDQTTQEFAQFQIVLPRKWNNGTVTAVFYWTAAAGTGDVQWGISGGAYSNDDALTVAFGSAQTADDTLLATNDLHITAATAAITLAGTPADADFLAFQISRNPGSDTLSADAKLLGVSIRITTDSAIDA